MRETDRERERERKKESGNVRERERDLDKVQTPGCSESPLSELLKGREHRKPQTL